MSGPAFSLANLRDTGRALFGPNWHARLAWELKLPERAVRKWCEGGPLPDIRERLADICRTMAALYNPDLVDLALKLEQLGPPVRGPEPETQPGVLPSSRG
jgi:hypothetical protein